MKSKFITSDKAYNELKKLEEQVLLAIVKKMLVLTSKRQSLRKEKLDIYHVRGDGNAEQVLAIRLDKTNDIWVRVMPDDGGETSSRLNTDNYPLRDIIDVLAVL